MDFHHCDADTFNHQELRMNCKHRWEQVNYIKSLPPNRYWYCCTRCGSFIKSILKEKP